MEKIIAESIPKVIHYVWVGRNPKNELVNKCIASWHKYCPNFQIIEWNEDNFPIDDWPFIKDALLAKNWALASDAMRIAILYEYGGIYFDTDLELIKPIDDLLHYSTFVNYESKYWVGTAVLATIPKHPIFKKILQRYQKSKAIEFRSNPLTVHVVSAAIRMIYKTKMDGKYRIIENVALLPQDYFYPMDYITYKLKITENSYAIHYYNGSWHSRAQKRGANFAKISRKILGKHIYRFFEKIVAVSFYKTLKKEFKTLEKDLSHESNH